MSSSEDYTSAESSTDDEPIAKRAAGKRRASKKTEINLDKSPKPKKAKISSARKSTRKSKSKKDDVAQPLAGDGYSATHNYAPREKLDSVGNIEYNGYLGNQWYLRISRYEKGNKRQYICIRQFDEGGASKFGANLPIDMAPILTAACNDMYEQYKKAVH